MRYSNIPARKLESVEQSLFGPSIFVRLSSCRSHPGVMKSKLSEKAGYLSITTNNFRTSWLFGHLPKTQ